MRGRLFYLAYCGRKPEHTTPKADDGRTSINVLLALILLVCSTAPSLAGRLPPPPASCASLYVGTWTGNWGSTNVMPGGTAQPSNNMTQEWTCNGDRYTFFVPENGNTYTGILSADRTTIVTGATIATRVGSPPPSASKPTEHDHCSTPPPGTVFRDPATGQQCIKARNTNSLPRCRYQFYYVSFVPKPSRMAGSPVDPGKTDTSICGRPGENLKFDRWEALPGSAR